MGGNKMENITFKTNIIKDKLLLHDAVEMEKQECEREYASYIKYHSDQAMWYKNIENYEKLLKCIYKLNPLTLDISTYVISESFKISNTIVNIINDACVVSLQ